MSVSFDTISAPDVNSVQSKIPRHVAVIMDGNNRWAKAKGLAGIEGHRSSKASVRAAIKRCLRLGIEVLTFFAFSSENWRRPPEEVQALMSLFLEVLIYEIEELDQNGVQMRFIGDLSGLEPVIQQHIDIALERTKNNKKLTLVVAINYGGRWDITQATKKIAQQIKQNELAVADINEQVVAKNMMLSDLPPPDLCIRTGGVKRISNFMLWQLAYAELYFTNTFWPSFNEDEFDLAIEDYCTRQRRFGRTEEQVVAQETLSATASELE